MPFDLDYERAIHLDAEELAEGGIADAYSRLLPELRRFIENPIQIEEQCNNDLPSYSVFADGRQTIIHAPDLEDKDSWGRATFALFSIINQQLKNSTHRFYAINGGNDLFGIFLTPAEAIASRESLPEKRDWPYVPNDEPPWYGQHH